MDCESGGLDGETMGSRRVSRVEEACKEELSEILIRELKDPRIGFATITGVKMTPDLKHAQVYVSVLGSRDEVDRTFKGLESAKGWMRAHLGKRLRLKFLPEIEFCHDESSAEAQKLEALFRKGSEEIISGD